ncbi:universal stress protein [Natrialbaceae archaeon A-CW1-1]
MAHILVAIDSDEDRATAQVKSLKSLDLDPSATHVQLVHVFTNNPEGASVNQVAAIRRARKTLEAAGFDTSIESRSGDPAPEILKAAEEDDVDVISVAGRKRSPTGKAIFGSVAQEVFLNTERPVLLSSLTVTR